jgi:protein-S-isoprenylcysteine O-methyltransferase Ste14
VSSVVGFAIAILIGTALFAGLPLAGWGLADIQGFISNPARLSYLVVVVLLQIFVTWKFPGAGRSQSKGRQIVRRQQVAVVLLQVLSLAIVIVAPFSDRHQIGVLGAADAIRFVGLALFAAGFSAMNWSAASLGKQFSVQVTLQADHQLITGGLYQYVRHPRYLSIIVCNCGIALVFDSWLALLCVAALVLVLLWRIHDEEALLRQEFGSQWETYAHKSWRLIPFVY